MVAEAAVGRQSDRVSPFHRPRAHKDPIESFAIIIILESMCHHRS
jgi:hypothetical protein